MSYENKLEINILEWTVRRAVRAFRSYVVQPEVINPENHSEIFDSCLQFLGLPTGEETLSFDLVTFPEAFLNADVLCAVLESVTNLKFNGCVHVGLRATDESRHLFKISEVKNLLLKLSKFGEKASGDLDAVRKWIEDLQPGFSVNLGCLFMLDSDGDIRICIHPKLLRSKFERSTFLENDMHEATLHTLVKFVPINKNLLPVVVHPLICSDGLKGNNDRREPRPLDILSTAAEKFDERLPDHIDIVSMCTATPQKTYSTIERPSISRWHPDFRSSFISTVSEDASARHHFSIFVISNFAHVDKRPAGLSGVFVPVGIGTYNFPHYVDIYSFGFPDDGSDQRWGIENDFKNKNSKKAYMATLQHHPDSPKVQIMGFTVPRLLRDTSFWNSPQDLSRFVLYRSEIDILTAQLVFKREN